MADIVVLSVAFASLVVGVLAHTLPRVHDIFDDFKKYGDSIHVSLGVFTAYLFQQNPLASFTLAFLYLAYQYADYEIHKDSLDKDIAVFTAALAATLGYIYGIPVKLL